MFASQREPCKGVRVHAAWNPLDQRPFAGRLMHNCCHNSMRLQLRGYINALMLASHFPSKSLPGSGASAAHLLQTRTCTDTRQTRVFPPARAASTCICSRASASENKTTPQIRTKHFSGVRAVRESSLRPRACVRACGERSPTLKMTKADVFFPLTG